MSVSVVVGAQWGDEGKGKIIDILSERTDIIARYQGGHNAGHTVVIGDKKFILHLIPSGILHKDKICIIGNGLVVDLSALNNELNKLKEQGISADGRLFISKKAHIIMPYHQIYDKGNEDSEGGRTIGTTKRGIGPAYADKMARIGIRIEDIVDEATLIEKLKISLREKNSILKSYYRHEGFHLDEIVEKINKVKGDLLQYIADTGIILRDSIKAGKMILCEGAQGAMLDIDHGTYPYVTSSNAISGGACTGLGIPPNRINHIIGVIKAYTTRVGDGPFPTELKDASGDLLRKTGNEFGSTTGRPRRCGWFDSVVARYSAWINGIDTIALTKLDVLSQCKKIYLCTAYSYKGKTLDEMPSELNILNECTPIYKEIDGWEKDISGITTFAALPDNTKRYIDELTREIDREITMISTGQRRDEIIVTRQ